MYQFLHIFNFKSELHRNCTNSYAFFITTLSYIASVPIPLFLYRGVLVPMHNANMEFPSNIFQYLPDIFTIIIFFFYKICVTYGQLWENNVFLHVPYVPGISELVSLRWNAACTGSGTHTTGTVRSQQAKSQKHNVHCTYYAW